MKRLIASSFIAAGLCTGVAMAKTPAEQAAPPQAAPAPSQRAQAQAAADQQGAPPKVETALHHAMEGAQFKVGQRREVNGVGVYDVEVSNQFGQSVAAITENGDFLVSGVPHNPARIPGPVDHAISRLFKSKPQNVDKYTVTNYLVDVEAEGEPTRLVIDGVGRIRDIKSAAQLKHAEDVSSKEQEDTDPERRRRMEAVIERLYGEKDAHIDHIYPMPNIQNFYDVEYKGPQGQEVQLVTNGNDVFSRRVTLTESELPAPITSTLHAMFNADKVVHVFRKRYDYYQFDLTAPDGDVVAMKVGSDGVVLGVNTSKGAEETTAAEKRHRERQAGHKPPL